jgi:hypothetical protein
VYPEGRDARVADPQENVADRWRQSGRLQIGMVAGFISEPWPASNPKPGRLHIGSPGRIKSESAPDREAVLAELGRVARDKFGGRVVRNMTTSLYIARRSA